MSKSSHIFFIWFCVFLLTIWNYVQHWRMNNLQAQIEASQTEPRP